MDIVQIFILLIGASSIWFISRKEKWSKWGYLIGMCGQPFWLYTSYVNQQWGIFALSVWYLYAWGQGIKNFIIDPLRGK